CFISFNVCSKTGQLFMLVDLISNLVWSTVEVNMEDKVEVFAGETAQITCMFTTDEGPGGTTIQWFYVSRSGEKQRIYNKEPMQEAAETSTPFKDRISLNVNGTTAVLIIRKVGVKDEVEFICVIKTLTDGTGEGRTKLKVFGKTQTEIFYCFVFSLTLKGNDLLFFEFPVLLSSHQIGSCEVKNGYPRPNITWYRNTTPLRNAPGQLDMLTTVTTESSGLFSVKSDLKMIVKKEDKDAKFYCEVVYFVPGATRMTESPHINITVYYLPTAVDIWVESPKGKIKEGDTLELRCEDNGNYPSSVITIKHSDVRNSALLQSLLSNVTRSDSGVYECALFDSYTLFLSVCTDLDPAVITPKDSTVVMEGEELKASCNALSSLQTATTWVKNEEVVSKDNILVIKNATFDIAGMYMCVVTVPEIEGMETSGTLRVNVKGPPKIVGPDFQEVETYETTVNLSCSFRGFPVPTIIWTTDTGSRVTEDGTQSVVTVNVISSVTAFCNASNDLGTKVAVFNIKASEFLQLLLKSKGFVIAVIIICILLLAVLGSVLYFLYKKGRICGRSGKQDLTKGKSSKDNIVVEMKSDNTEEAVLLGVNGEKQPPNDQA
uniref:Melanoma cell adhesion molecule b n=1 Tax=Amphilophus citrinellus TaxID=61819 RepID=A0A3Q0QTG6_AMPCI